MIWNLRAHRWLGVFVGTLVSAVALSACLFGAKKGESWYQRRIRDMTPASLRSERKVDLETVKVAKVRVYADQEHRVQFLRWTERFGDTLDGANQVLIPELGIRLEVVEFRPWERVVDNRDLSPMLDELRGLDPGADVDWVIGLVSALDAVSADMHKLGVADLLGRHLVMRGYNEVAERQWLAKAGVRDGDVEKLVALRRPHQLAAVLLHEIGHTLGALHVMDGTHADVMRSGADHKAIGFSQANADMMRSVLEARGLADGKVTPETALKRQALAFVRHLDSVSRWSGWSEAEVANMRAWASARTAAQEPGGPVEAEAEAAASRPKARTGIPEEARSLFARAQGLAKGGQLDAALAQLGELIQAYPAQIEFRIAACQVGLAKDIQSGQGHCARVGELAPADVRGDVLLAQAHVAAGDVAAGQAIVKKAVERLRGLGQAATEGREADAGQADAWLQILGFYQAIGAVTWAEEVLAMVPASAGKDLTPYREWAQTVRRRYGLPPNGKRHGIAPDNEGAYVALVRAVLDQVYGNKYDAAQATAEKGLKQFRDAPGILGALCDLELRRKRFGPAQGMCKRALKAYEEASWAQYLMGIIELRNKRNAVGIAHLERAILLDPDLRQAYHALEKAYERKKDTAGQERLRNAYQQRFQSAMPR